MMYLTLGACEARDEGYGSTVCPCIYVSVCVCVCLSVRPKSQECQVQEGINRHESKLS